MDAKSAHVFTRTITDRDNTIDSEPDAIYIEQDGLFVRFLCPCGCGNEYRLLNREHEQAKDHFEKLSRWTVKIEDSGRVTLHPSVHWVGHAHFWIKDGRVVWH